ncbi:MAG: rhodanese-like domain-containing protein [Haliscomenobacter sp.]|nr:rhodanese-like domain-containing protein [Haliscomenobacter sp.]
MMEEACPLSRWEMLRQLLNNLALEDLPRWLEDHPDWIVLDVRTPEEFQASSLPGAVNLDYLGIDFIDRLLALDKEKGYLVYCRSGRRSVRVSTLLRNGGFPHVYHLHGGLPGGVISVTEQPGEGS